MARPRLKSVKDCESGACALITAIWNHFGGPTEVATLCGVKPRDVFNWEERGRVSLEYLWPIVAKLDLPPNVGFFALNFIESSLTRSPPERHIWNDVVRVTCSWLNLSHQIKDEILFLEPPKLPKIYKK